MGWRVRAGSSDSAGPRRRPVLRVAVAAMVVLALGGSTGTAVTLTVPVLAGASSPGPLPVVRPVPVLGPLPVAAPAPTADGVNAELAPLITRRGLGTFTGVVTDPATGTVLWERSAGTALVPGSTGKLLTAAATLLTLNPTDRLVTRVVAGPESGTVVLVGGGDPTLTALAPGTQGVYPDPSRLTALADGVRAAGVPVTQVLVDTARYRGPTLAVGWDPADVRGGFVAPIQPVMVDGGRVDPLQQDGQRVVDPALAAGRALAGLLGADPATVAEGAATPGVDVLGTVTSAPVSDLVEHMVRSSDNVLAETLAREVAIARGSEPSFVGAAEATSAALAEAGFDTTGARMADASGLSTTDRVPASLLAALLTAAAGPVEGLGGRLRPIVTGLPVAGGEGTLDDRFAADSETAAGRGVVRAKTGTLTSVSSLAGVTTNADGRLLTFAFMSNGVNPAVVRPRLDAIATRLAGCGCR
jgi:serine-type D-Ala-D-Ala carboxypeptidase/endopeptidase (penicillin-binding protein 4)